MQFLDQGACYDGTCEYKFMNTAVMREKRKNREKSLKNERQNNNKKRKLGFVIMIMIECLASSGYDRRFWEKGRLLLFFFFFCSSPSPRSVRASEMNHVYSHSAVLYSTRNDMILMLQKHLSERVV